MALPHFRPWKEAPHNWHEYIMYTIFGVIGLVLVFCLVFLPCVGILTHEKYNNPIRGQCQRHTFQ